MTTQHYGLNLNEEESFSSEVASIFSDGSADFVDPPSPHILGQRVKIRVRNLENAPIAGVKLRIFPDGEERLLNMKRTVVVPFSIWEAEVSLNCTPFRYRFRIQTPRQIFWLCASGLTSMMPPDEEDFRLVPGFIPPSWLKDTVFYQIFPDRFWCGRPEISKTPRKTSPAFTPTVIKKWDDPISKSNFGAEFYGGDLWGIIEKLPHLERLGVNAIYLNPIFESPSNHKYDCIDYYSVDPFFGGNSALEAFSQSLSKRGFRYILDGAFNHAGVNHPWFRKSQADKKSRFFKMFTFNKHPGDFVSWLGHSNLPKFDYSSRKLREVVYKGKNGIAKMWLRPPFSASGWRLDAPNMLGCGGTDEKNLEIWREFRKEIKSEHPDSYLLGECFFEGTKWLQGDAFDAVMNYKGFTIPLIQWLTGRDLHLDSGEIHGRELKRWMNSVMARIPFEIRNLQYNALSTHDIVRFIQRVGMNEKIFRLAVGLQMAFPGVPAVYYGEELSLPGGEDPDNRRPMPWNTLEKNQSLIEYMGRMIRLRREMRVLQKGAFCFLAAEENSIAFARFLGDSAIVVAANRSSVPCTLSVPVGILGLRDGDSLRSILTLDSLKIVHKSRVDLFLGGCEALWLVSNLKERGNSAE